jgi:nucleoid-associated protein YgaU
MFNNFLKGLMIIVAVAFVTGCTMRTYVQEKGRVDQDMAGNGGCIQGTCPQTDRSNVSKTRDTYVLEVVTGPKKIEASKAKSTSSDTVAASSSEEAEPTTSFNQPVAEETSSATELSSATEYKIEEGDTLQKISKKFYGTVKRWNEIYQANKDVISNPNRLRPGKTIRIPQK